MRLAGTPDTSWVPIDLREVAAAIATLRAATAARGVPVRRQERSVPRR